MVAHNPLNRSGRAELPHPALASGDDAKAAQRIGVTDAGRGQPALNQPGHAVPPHTAVLAASRQRAMPEPTDLAPQQQERVAVHGYTVIADVPSDHRAQPFTLRWDGSVQAPLELSFHVAELGLQPFAHRLPKQRKHPVTSLLPADVREAEEVEGLGLPLTVPRSVVSRERAELQEAGLFGVQLQPELVQSFAEFHPEPLGIRPMLEPEHNVIGIAHDDHVAARLLLPPRPGPQANA